MNPSCWVASIRFGPFTPPALAHLRAASANAQARDSFRLACQRIGQISKELDKAKFENDESGKLRRVAIDDQTGTATYQGWHFGSHRQPVRRACRRVSGNRNASR